MSNANEGTGAVAPKISGLNHRVVLHAVSRYPILFAVVVLLSAGTAASVWFFLPLPKVTAVVVFHVAVQPPSLLPGASSDGVPFPSYKQSQASLVKSRMTLSSVLKQPGVSGLGVVRMADNDPLSWLERSLVVDPKSTSELMRVTLEGEDGEELVAVLRAVAKVYLANADERDNGARKRKLAKLEESQQSYRAEVDRYQGQIDKIALALGSKDGPTLAALDAIHKEDLRLAAHDLSVAREQFLLAERELAAWDAANTPKPGAVDPSPVAIPEAAVNRELQQDRMHLDLEAAVVRAEQALTKAKNDFDEGSPALVAARDKLLEAQAKRDKYRTEQRVVIETRLREIHRQTEKARRDVSQHKLAGLAQRVQVNEERLETAKKAIAKSNEHRIDLDNYKRLSEQNEQLSLQMSREVERLKIELGAPPRVTLAEEPYALSGLEGNRRLKYALMAGVAVFLIGFGGLVGWEYRSRRVTHTDEVTTNLGVRLLGTVPPREKAGGAQTPLARAALVEAIDTTRTMLLHGAPAGTVLRTLLITSAGSGEGKTSLAGHLAISLARAGFNTLLVDGDLQSPSAHSLFDLPAGPGLCELLRGEVETTAAVRTTSLPGLSVLSAGAVDLIARQCLIGTRWRQIRQELESRFDFLVIDTAPLLVVSDTLLLAREADGVVLSVLLGVSQVSHVSVTATRLRAVGANLTGAVVNGVWQDAHVASSRYGAALSRSPEPTPVGAAGPAGNKEAN
jgi:capsular exopolysaccharide synthesis family protein